MKACRTPCLPCTGRNHTGNDDRHGSPAWPVQWLQADAEVLSCPLDKPFMPFHHEIMSQLRILIAAAVLAGSPIPVAQAQDGVRSGDFAAEKAWNSFEQLVRNWYAYADRPEVDGVQIIAHFRPLALSASNDAEFIAVLKLLARNYADPHFVVGPLNDEDWAIIPTASDIYGEATKDDFIVEQVREGSAAYDAGVRRGARIITIDGMVPAEAIEAVTGRLAADLSPAQRNFALNVALAGKRSKERVVELEGPSGRVLYRLAPTAEQAREVRNGPLVSTERHGDLAVIRINNSLGENALIAEFAAALAKLQDAPSLLIDLRNTPSGGNTTVARGIMGHFVDGDRPYQLHSIPGESRVFGPNRKFLEYVSPFGDRYRGKVYVAGGRWTGSMGEGMMIGFDAIGATTVGTELADLLGALTNLRIEGSDARVDFATEALFTITGIPREQYRPNIYLEDAERSAASDPVIAAVTR